MLSERILQVEYYPHRNGLQACFRAASGQQAGNYGGVMTTPRKPWVGIAASEYYNLTSDAETLIYLAKTLFEKAVFGRHNPVLLEKVLDIMPITLKTFRQQARLANSKRGHRQGARYPKWVVTALEESLALTDDVRARLTDLEQAYEHDDWRTVENATRMIYEAILKIQEYLLSGPPPTIVSEANDIADEFWREWGESYE